MPMNDSDPTDVVELRDLAIFEAGDYPQGRFDEAFLRGLAERYDPAFHEAPNYLDHEDDAGRRPAGGLAFGWVRRLYVKGRTLFADLAGVPRRFADLVLAGRIKKRSVEIYPDLAGRGPYLRALAWPMIPEVKGLADVHPTQIFADQSPPFVCISFQEKESPMPTNEQESQFVTLDRLNAMLDALKAELTAAVRHSHAQAEVRTFCEQMVLAGKMTPAERATEEPLLLAQVQRELTQEFAENETPLSRQRMEYFRTRPPVVAVSGPAAPAADDNSPDRKTVRYFHEHEAFFTRLGVTLEDLLAAEKAQAQGSNALVA